MYTLWNVKKPLPSSSLLNPFGLQRPEPFCTWKNVRKRNFEKLCLSLPLLTFISGVSLTFPVSAGKNFCVSWVLTFWNWSPTLHSKCPCTLSGGFLGQQWQWLFCCSYLRQQGLTVWSCGHTEILLPLPSTMTRGGLTADPLTFVLCPTSWVVGTSESLGESAFSAPLDCHLAVHMVLAATGEKTWRFAL